MNKYQTNTGGSLPTQDLRVGSENRGIVRDVVIREYNNKGEVTNDSMSIMCRSVEGTNSVYRVRMKDNVLYDPSNLTHKLVPFREWLMCEVSPTCFEYYLNFLKKQNKNSYDLASSSINSV